MKKKLIDALPLTYNPRESIIYCLKDGVNGTQCLKSLVTQKTLMLTKSFSILFRVKKVFSSTECSDVNADEPICKRNEYIMC